jgi:hypothetical protein
VIHGKEKGKMPGPWGLKALPGPIPHYPREIELVALLLYTNNKYKMELNLIIMEPPSCLLGRSSTPTVLHITIIIGRTLLRTITVYMSIAIY